MGDIDRDKRSSPVRVVGGGSDNEEYLVNVTSLEEISNSDILNNGGLDTTLTIGTTAIELKVGASVKENRKLLMFTALDNGFTFGFSSLTQNIPILKNQTVILNVGENTEVWAINTSSNKSMAVAEL